MRRNKNRGYQQLRVWIDAIDYYAETCRVFHRFPYELNRVARQAIVQAIPFIGTSLKVIADAQFMNI
jgi:hypothetical protein